MAAAPFVRSRTAIVTEAPWAASARVVSTPRPADAPVTRIRLPVRSIPSRTSSVVLSNPKLRMPAMLARIARGAADLLG